MVLFNYNTKINLISETQIDKNYFTNIFTVNDEEDLCYYQGQMNNNKWNGYGKLWTKYFKYHGNFKNGKVHGHGTYEYIEKNHDLSDEFVKYYEGDFEEGDKNGIGKEIYFNNESYFGSFKNSLRNGNGTLYNSNGSEKIKCFWKDGAAINTTQITEHWENGNIKYKGGFNGVKWHGNGVICYKNGSIFFEGNIDNNNIVNGIIKSLDNRKIIEGDFINGNYTFYHNNGTRYLESSNSEIREYNENGILIFKGTIYNNLLNFLENYTDCKSLIDNDIKILDQSILEIRYKKGIMYFDNTSINENKVKYILEYDENNLLTGEYKAFNQDSLLTKSCNYLKGEKNGPYFEFYQNGKTKIECKLINNKYSGEFKEFFDDENSTISMIGEYVTMPENSNDIKLINVRTFFPNGKKKFEGSVINKRYHDEGKIYFDNESNSISYHGEFKNGKYDGHGTLYHENGNNLYSGSWQNGLRNGQGSSFYESGSIEYFGDWLNNEKHGQGNLFNEAGEQVWTGNFHYNEIQMTTEDSSE